MSKSTFVTTSLDSLPYGEIDVDALKGTIVKSPQLPDGITGKMMYKDILRIALPALVEMILTQLTTMVDQIMVGRLPGTAGIIGLAAVGLCAQVKFLWMTMIQALNVGTTAVIARFRGQQNREQANNTFRQSLLFSLVLSAVFVAIAIPTAMPFLHLMGGEGIADSTYQAAHDYYLIQMYGFIPLCLTFTFTAVLRGVGDSRIPMLYNTAANVINILFNYFLIYGKCGFPEMQVIGASLATVIGQTSAFVFAFIFMLNKKHYLFLDFKRKFKLDMVILRNVVTIGIPSMLEQMFMRLGTIIYTRTVTSLGEISYATHLICSNIQGMSFVLGMALASASTTLMGQSLGKKRLDMAENYTKYSNLVGLYLSLVLGAILALFGRNIVGAYNRTPEIITLGGNIMIMVGFSQPFYAVQCTLAGALRGSGDTRYPAVTTLYTVVGVRGLLAVIFIRFLHFGLWGAWIAMVSDQIIRTTLLQLHYRKGDWRFIRLKTNG